MRLTSSLVALSLVTLAGTAGAQVCLGTPSFATGPIRIDAGLLTGNDNTQYGAGLAVGTANGPFVSAGVNRVDIDGVDESATGFSVAGGFEVNLTDRRGTRARRATSLSLCPVASFSRAGVDFEESGIEAETSIRTFSAGLSLGAMVPSSPNFSLVPFGGLSYANSKASLEIDGEEFGDSEAENYFVLDLGLGLVLNRSFTIRPTIGIPIGLDEADPNFGVSFHINFGRGR